MTAPPPRTVVRPCLTCDGAGKHYDTGRTCFICDGNGTVRRTIKELEPTWRDEAWTTT